MGLGWVGLVRIYHIIRPMYRRCGIIPAIMSLDGGMIYTPYRIVIVIVRRCNSSNCVVGESVLK